MFYAELQDIAEVPKLSRATAPWFHKLIALALCPSLHSSE
jgi:hypothetical protein